MKHLTTLGLSTLIGIGMVATACGDDTETGGTGGTSSTSSSTTTSSNGSGGGDGGDGGTSSGSGGGTGGSGGSSSGAGGDGGGGGSFPCGDDNLECTHPQICVTFIQTQGPTQTTTWECHDDPCAPAPLDCSCAGTICAGGPGSGCQINQGNLECHSGGVCAAPDTPIFTPEGQRPIASLAAGDLVYSLHEGRLQAVPLGQVSRRVVRNHAVVEVTLSSGAKLQISAPHPTADGRRFADLQPGSRLGDQTVVAVATVPYEHDHTYDIRPASDTGTYVAAGALVGTTLPAP